MNVVPVTAENLCVAAGAHARRFSYFLFENFDPAEASDDPGNPRLFLRDTADGLLSRIVDGCEPERTFAAVCARFGADLTERLLAGGILRREGETLFLDTPLFLAEDAGPITAFCTDAASRLAGLLTEKKREFQALAEELQNGFSAEVNLYHVVCGMCLDGLFLDRLSSLGLLSEGRPHASGLDYLAVIYEKCPELDRFSDGLLCSWNRLADEDCALQSFGDGNGDRMDCYRYFRLRELGWLTERYAEADRLLAGMTEAELLQAAKALLTGQPADPLLAAALEFFGYASGGRICVPVYGKAQQETVAKIEALLEQTLLEPVSALLADADRLPITAAEHGVPRAELANELWHVLFGSINEALVQTGFAAAPLSRPGEGRYLQSVEIGL